MALEFRKELFQSRGNALNLKDDLIAKLVDESDGLDPQRKKNMEYLRAKYIPDTGYVPGNPINRAESNRYWNYMMELRAKAGAANEHTPIMAQYSIARDILNLQVFRGIGGASSIKDAVLTIVRNASDACSENEHARIKMMVAFHNHVAKYIKMMNAVYLAEKKDSLAYLFYEMERAYVSYNRYEHFFLGKGAASIHHDVSIAATDMEKAWRGAEAKRDGGTLRRLYGMSGDKGELILPSILELGSSALDKVKKLVS